MLFPFDSKAQTWGPIQTPISTAHITLTVKAGSRVSSEWLCLSFHFYLLLLLLTTNVVKRPKNRYQKNFKPWGDHGRVSEG